MPMRADELIAVLTAEKQDALAGANASKLAEERQRAMSYYNGDMTADIPAETDRSKAVSYDVADTVEGLMPSLMEIFCGGDEVVKFAPVGPEDEEQAEQETAYVNHVLMQKNPGFIIIYSFVKDALLQKNGIVKVWWEEKEDEERQTFDGIEDDVYALLAADETIRIVEHTEHPPGEEGAAATHDVTIVQSRKYGCCRVEPVPPEEFGCSRSAKLGQPLDYSYHEVRKSQASLIKQGFDPEQIRKLPTASYDTTGEATTRDTVDESSAGGKDETNRANRLVTVTEHYVMLDYEGDGKARLYRVTTGGDDANMQILRRIDEDEEPEDDIVPVDFDPFAAITPFIVTHRFFGKSAADLVIEIQRVKTSLTRGMLDNIYAANNQRLEVAEANAHAKTLEDILDNRIGGVVRTRVPGGIIPIPNQPIGDFVFPMVEYYDQVREWRTGVTRQGQGLDPDALQNIGEQAVIRAQNAAMEKTKLIARIFAETGFKDLMWKIHATVRKHETSQPTARLRNKWVAVDPREWKRRDDLTVSVGLGSGSKSEQMAFWSNEVSSQMEALNTNTGLTSPDKIFNALKRRMELAGERNAERYWTNPAEEPPPEPQPSPEQQKVEGELQIKQAELQANQQMQAAKMQSDQQIAQQKAAADMARIEAEMALKNRQMQAEFALKREQMIAEFELEREQMDREMQLRREGMVIDAKTKMSVGSAVRMGGKVG